jgi:RNA polymerase sigma-70 factor, ECF subfamily
MSDETHNAELAARHHAGLYRWALALSGREPSEAMEIVQTTYLEVLEGRADLSRARDPRAFLFGVARRVAASRRRRGGVIGRLLGKVKEQETVAPPAPTPETEVALSEDALRVRRALEELPPRQLEVTTLVFQEGLTVEEAADAMGVSVGSARTHYHRAKERLRKTLESNDERAG